MQGARESKGNTATNTTKSATVETGATVVFLVINGEIR
jgi:hypothetical protein